MAQAQSTPTLETQPGALVLPPLAQMLAAGTSVRKIKKMPPFKHMNDKMIYLAVELMMGEIIGANGTPLQLSTALQANPEYAIGMATMFLVKNKLKPTAGDVGMVAELAKECVRRLKDGDRHTRNRRAQLKRQGVVTDSGIASATLRAVWL